MGLNTAPQPVGYVGAKWSSLHVCVGGGGRRSIIQVLLASRGLKLFGGNFGGNCSAPVSSGAAAALTEGGLRGPTQQPSPMFSVGGWAAGPNTVPQPVHVGMIGENGVASACMSI